MANTFPNQIQANQSQKEVTANQDFLALFSASLFANNYVTTAALTFGYFGGYVVVDGVLTNISDGTLTLADNTTNYIETTRAGVVSSNTTGFTVGRKPLFVVVTASSIITSILDQRVLTQTFEGYLTLSVAGAANVTLTQAQASNDILNLTGILTGNITVFLPAIAWRKQIRNNTTGGFTLTVAPTGGTGVVVIQGSSVALWSDGTNATQGISVLESRTQNSISSAYTTVSSDAGKQLLHPSADITARTWTIDSNANVPYPIGTELRFINQNAAGTLTIAITTDTMRLAGAGTVGSRTLTANGVATAEKVTAAEWIISGTNLT